MFLPNMQLLYFRAYPQICSGKFFAIIEEILEPNHLENYMSKIFEWSAKEIYTFLDGLSLRIINNILQVEKASPRHEKLLTL